MIAFIEYMKLQGLSLNTMAAYMATVRMFLARHDPDLATPMDVRNFIYSMSPPSRRRHWAALKAFYRRRPYNPVADIPIPPATIPRIHVPSVTEASLIIESVTDPRNRLILELLYGSGFRVGALIRIRISDVDLSNRWIVLHDKGARQHVKPFGAKAAQWMGRYLSERRSHSDLLFPGLTDRTVRRIIANACDRVGLPRIGPHSFRHAFAAHVRKNGADIVELKNLLGHSRIESTERYLAITPVTLTESLKKHPRK